MVHEQIKPIKAYVHESVLYDEDMEKQDMIECTVFALSSYQGESLTFAIALADGSVFFYIPPHKLSLKKDGKLDYDLADLVYHNCAEEEFLVQRMDLLGEEPVSVYLKKADAWVNGEYMFTVDWYKGNDLLHMIVLENGQFCFMPSHKIKFLGGERSFVHYKKMHSTWSV